MKGALNIFRNDLFNGKVAIVTGGGTGIGKAIATDLYNLGCKVVIASRSKDKLDDAAKEICSVSNDSNQAKILPIACNIRKEEEVKNLISTTLKTFGKLDYLVNNGGGQFLSPASSISLKGWQAVVETNLTGNFLLCREAYNQWMEANGGTIVNILMDFLRGYPMMAHSAAARAGLDNLTKSLAIEWAQNGVRVNAVAPGNSIYSETAAKNYPDNIFDIVKPHLPTKRLGVPEEISAAICFLLSPGASFITGETLAIDGGGRLYSPLFHQIPEHNNLPPFTSKL